VQDFFTIPSEQFSQSDTLYNWKGKMNIPKREIFLILRAQTGDRAAFDELLKSIQAALFQYIFRLVGEHGAAEDIMQEVFLIIYRKLRWLENPQLFRAWAYRIASRETFKRLKRERRWAALVYDEEVLDKIPARETTEIYEPELIEKLPTLVSNVSPASRAVLILHYLDEMPLSEVAEILDISLGTVKSRLAYGLARLREEIKGEK
jgi:RNA polymerase sigma-70 factor (ECF subfamily)